MAKRYDAVLIGGGYNGLTTAAYLAKAGKQVVVLEKNSMLGGAAVTVEDYPGFRFSAMSYVVSLLRPEIIRELELPKHGLEILPLDGTITPLDDDSLWRVNDHGTTVRELRRWSKNDAEAYEEYGLLMAEMARFIKPILSIVPPDPGRISPMEWLPLTGLAKDFKDLPQKLQTTFIQLMTGISTAIAEAALALGAEIRTRTPVVRVKIVGGRATGVVLESGEEVDAGVVMSSLDSRWTFIKLLDEGVLDPVFREEVLRYKYRGSSGKVNLALDSLPQLACKPGRGDWLRGAISFSPSIDYMERAYDDAKYGRYSNRPYIDCIIPTLVDPSMAPPGKHVMSCFVQYAPYHLADGQEWTPQLRDEFGETVIDTLEERFPDIRSKILHRLVLSPKDIEDWTGLSEGNIFQGELSLEQLFFNRPVPGWARYRTPVRDLWMCGSATHPGGGIMGAPGRIAAIEYLKEKRRRRNVA